MFVSVFKSNHRIVTLFVLVLTALMCLSLFTSGSTNYLFGYAIIDYAIAVGLICFQAIYFNRIVNREKLVENNTYLTSLFIVLFNCSSFISLGLNGAILANTFIVIGITQLFKIYNEKFKMAQVFNASLLFGIATVLFHPYIVWLPLLFILIFYLTTPIWRDIAVLFIGYGLPILYAFAYLFFTGDSLTIDLEGLINLTPGVSLKSLNTGEKGFLITVVALSLPACLFFVRSITQGVVKVRKLLWSVVIVGLFGLFTLVLNGGDVQLLLVALCLPLAVLLANFFEQFKIKWLSELMFLCLLAGSAWIYFS